MVHLVSEVAEVLRDEALTENILCKGGKKSFLEPTSTRSQAIRFGSNNKVSTHHYIISYSLNDTIIYYIYIALDATDPNFIN